MKSMALAAFAAAAMLGSAPSVIAETLEETIDSFRPGDYARASEFFLPLARQGNVAAQESLGAMYASGNGVARDYVQAHLWVSRALKQAEGAAAAARLRQMLSGFEAEMTPDELAKARGFDCAPKNLRV